MRAETLATPALFVAEIVAQTDGNDFALVISDVDCIDEGTLAAVIRVLHSRASHGWIAATMSSSTPSPAIELLLPLFTQTVTVPALRYRIEDIEVLVPFLLRELTSGADVALNTLTADSLTVAAGGAITQTGTLNVTGITTIAAAGQTVALGNANQFGGGVAVTGADVTLADADSIDLRASTVSGNLAVTATTGTITQSGALNVTGNSTFTAADGQSISLTSAGNTFSGVQFASSGRLDDITLSRALARRIEERFGYRSEPWEETNSNVLGIFVIQNGIMYSTVGAILIVACFGIFNVISTVIYEKTRDIAILKSMGFREADIKRIFIIEGVLVGLVGTALGWLLGSAIVEFLGSLEFKVEGFIKAQGFVLYRSWTHYAVAGGFAMLSATVAAWLPARKAARVNPVDIVRGAA